MRNRGVGGNCSLNGQQRPVVAWLAARYTKSSSYKS
jgi:hypothetical protein